MVRGAVGVEEAVGGITAAQQVEWVRRRERRVMFVSVMGMIMGMIMGMTMGMIMAMPWAVLIAMRSSKTDAGADAEKHEGQHGG